MSDKAEIKPVPVKGPTSGWFTVFLDGELFFQSAFLGYTRHDDNYDIYGVRDEKNIFFSIPAGLKAPDEHVVDMHDSTGFAWAIRVGSKRIYATSGTVTVRILDEKRDKIEGHLDFILTDHSKVHGDFELENRMEYPPERSLGSDFGIE